MIAETLAFVKAVKGADAEAPLLDFRPVVPGRPEPAPVAE